MCVCVYHNPCVSLFSFCHSLIFFCLFPPCPVPPPPISIRKDGNDNWRRLGGFDRLLRLVSWWGEPRNHRPMPGRGSQIATGRIFVGTQQKKKSTQVCAGEPHPAKTWRFKTWGCKNYYWLMLLCHSLQYYCTGLPTSYLRMLQTWTREKNAQYCFFFFPLARANKPDGWITGVVFLVMGNGRTNKGCVYVVFDEHNRMEQGEKQRIHSYQWRNTCPSEIPIC